jgi:hypothetical protein
MKHLGLLILSLAVTLTVSAQQKVTIKAGTVIPMQSVNSLKGGECFVGQAVEFRIIQDVQVDGVTVVPAGTITKGKVFEAKKSTIAGTKGRFGIRVSNIVLPSGDIIYLADSEARVFGKNRTPVAVITALFIWPLIFIPGTAAVMPEGYQIDAAVASNTTITVN